MIYPLADSLSWLERPAPVPGGGKVTSSDDSAPSILACKTMVRPNLAELDSGIIINGNPKLFKPTGSGTFNLLVSAVRFDSPPTEVSRM